MIYEIAITPHAIRAMATAATGDVKQHPLRYHLLQRDEPANVLVSQMLQGRWLRQALQSLSPAQRQKLQDLVQLIDMASIPRDGIRDEPETEQGWIKAANQIAKVGGHNDATLVCCRDGQGDKCFDEANFDEAFTHFYPGQQVDLSTESQKPIFKRLLAYGDWYLFTLPRVREKRTLIQFLRLAAEMLQRQQHREIEVFLVAGESWTRDPSGSEWEKIKRLGIKLGKRLKLSIYSGPAELNRFLYIGDKARIRNGLPFHKLRWRVAMQHVATDGENLSQNVGNRWSVDTTSVRRGDPEKLDELLRGYDLITEIAF